MLLELGEYQEVPVTSENDRLAGFLPGECQSICRKNALH